ncbi:MAG: T9SS type A sorting domain-containing protein [Bacteroidota bacterium]
MHKILESPLREPWIIETVDLNNDNQLDIVTSSQTDRETVIYLNNGDNTFLEQSRINHFIGSSNKIDFNRDGFMDLVMHSVSERKLLLFRNDGAGNLILSSTIATFIAFVGDILVEDINNDGNSDIIIAASYDDSIIWYENNQEGQFSPGKVIASDVSLVGTLSASDLDQDGDLDIVSGSLGNGEIIWHENLNSSESFSARSISNDGISTDVVLIDDFSGDGFPDILSLSEEERKISLYENIDGQHFSSEIVISRNAHSSNFIKTSDFDGDGDRDIITVLANYNFVSRSIVWYENDGEGNFDEPIIIDSGLSSPTDVNIVDFDEDGDLDLIFLYREEDRINWFENIFNHPSIQGTTFWDENGNANFDSSEIALTNLNIRVIPEEISSYTDWQGKFRFYVPNGTYTLTVEPDSCYQLTTDSLSYTVTIEDNVAVDKNFGFQLASDYQHTQARLNSVATRCGFTVPFTLSVQNDGCVPSTGQYGLVLSDLATLVESAVEPTSVSGDTLFWDYEQLFSSEDERVNLMFEIAGTDFLGDTIRMTALSYIENDRGELELSSTYDYASEIRCAYDPNDKLVYPNRAGEYDKSYTLFEETFEYTVRFQNTGTDTAFTVVIKDYLDGNLDWKTFKPVLSSHPHETLLHSDGLVEFTFRNILLPDSTTNEPLSHGFVTYKIAPQNGLEENTAIENTADIFFDFNPPITTNTTSNVMVSELPKVTSIKDWELAESGVTVFPNPFDQTLTFQLASPTEARLLLFDATGRVLLSQSFSGDTLDIQLLNRASGLYFYQVWQADGELLGQGKVVKE